MTGRLKLSARFRWLSLAWRNYRRTEPFEFDNMFPLAVPLRRDNPLKVLPPRVDPLAAQSGRLLGSLRADRKGRGRTLSMPPCQGMPITAMVKRQSMQQAASACMELSQGWSTLQITCILQGCRSWEYQNHFPSTTQSWARIKECGQVKETIFLVIEMDNKRIWFKVTR